MRVYLYKKKVVVGEGFIFDDVITYHLWDNIRLELKEPVDVASKKYKLEYLRD